MRSILVGYKSRFYSLKLFVELSRDESRDDFTSSNYVVSSCVAGPSGVSWSSFLYSGVRNFYRYRLYMFLSFSYIIVMNLLYSANIESTSRIFGSLGSLPNSSAKKNSYMLVHSKGRAAPITISVVVCCFSL